MSSFQQLNKQLSLTTRVITSVLMAGLLLPTNLSSFFIDEATAGIGGPVPRHGTVMTRGIERTAAGNPIWAEIGIDGLVVADINEAAGEYKDAKAISVLSYLSIVAAYNSFKIEHADGIAKGATVLTRDAYAQKVFPDVTVTLASTTQGVVNTKVVSITKYNLRDNTQSVLIRHEDTVIDPDLLPTKGPQRGMILYEAPIDLRKTEIKTSFDPSVKTLLISSTGKILEESPHNIGYKTSFYKTDENGNGTNEALGPVVGSSLDAGIYSLNYSTLSQADGKYNLTIFIPPCPGFSFVHDYNIWAKVYYTNFNPEAPSALGFYYYKSPDSYHCSNLSGLLTGGAGSLLGQMTELAISSFETDTSTLLSEHNFYVDLLKFTGVGFVSNNTTPLPYGNTEYSYTAPELNKISPEKLDLNLDLVSDVAVNVSGTNYYDIYLDGQTTNADGTEKDADLQRLADVAPDFTDQGLLKSISISDMMKTDIYIYRVSNGKMVVKKKGLREQDIRKNGTGYAFNLTLPGPLDDLSDGLFKTSAEISQFQAAIGFPPEMIGRKVDFLRPGEEVKIIAINRPTGYIGIINTSVHTPIDGSYTVALDKLVMNPPNLKVKVERIYSVDSGSTRGEKKEYQVGFEGSALTSDTLILIHTEWFDPDGNPLPEKLEGYTGRLAKVVENKELVNSSGALSNFEIKPGSNLQVVKLEGDLIGTEHYYIHVSGSPTWENPGTGAGSGPLSDRPMNYVPIRVPVYDEVKTRQLRDINAYNAIDGQNVVNEVDAVYEWPYRPEMQFSVFDLSVNALRLTDQNNQTENINITGETQGDLLARLLADDVVTVDLLYDLFDSDNPALPTFGAGRELIFAFGAEEDLVTIDLGSSVSFTDMQHLEQLSSADLLSFRLYQNGDDENILWEYALGIHVEKNDPKYPNVNLNWDDYYPSLGEKTIIIRNATESSDIAGRTVKAEITYIQPDGNATVTGLTTTTQTARFSLDNGYYRAKFKLSGLSLAPSETFSKLTDKVTIKFTLLAKGSTQAESTTEESWYIKNNSNTLLAEVLDGKAAFIYDRDDEHYGDDNHKGVTEENGDKKFDYIQELLNQVVPRKRTVTDYTYIEDDGKFRQKTVTSIEKFKQEFKVDNAKGINEPNSFNKLIKDYNLSSSRDNIWLNRIVDKELLVGSTLSTTSRTVNTDTAGDTGLYELYENGVKVFVNAMIKEAERYASNEVTSTWIARDGEAATANGDLLSHGLGMSYCFGCKQNISTFNSTIASNCKPETQPQITARETPPDNGDEYRGNVKKVGEACNVVDTGGLRWVGLTKTELYTYLGTKVNNVYQKDGPVAFNNIKYWSGIDCSGFVQRTLVPAQLAASGVDLRGIAIPPKPAMTSIGNISSQGLFDTQYTYYQPRVTATDNDKIKQQKKLRKGDLVRYSGHISIVYSVKPEEDGSYQIIHAFGTRLTDHDDDLDTPNIFTRKVVLTSNNVKHKDSDEVFLLEPLLKGYGRIRLW